MIPDVNHGFLALKVIYPEAKHGADIVPKGISHGLGIMIHNK